MSHRQFFDAIQQFPRDVLGTQHAVLLIKLLEECHGDEKLAVDLSDLMRKIIKQHLEQLLRRGLNDETAVLLLDFIRKNPEITTIDISDIDPSENHISPTLLKRIKILLHKNSGKIRSHPIIKIEDLSWLQDVDFLRKLKTNYYHLQNI